MKTIQSVVFFGTHDLAVPALETLVELGVPPRLIVTRPEAGLPGEGENSSHPVREWSREHEVETVRSRRATEPEIRERIARLEPDLVVVVDYGRPLPVEVAQIAARGAVEVHPSLLPKLRGEHALRAALAAGERKAGVSVFLVDEVPWGGPIVLQEELDIGDRETYGQLLPRAGQLTRDLLAQILGKLDRSKGKPRGRKQNDKSATTTPRMDRRQRKAPWSLEASQVYDRLRAYSPPGLLAYYKYRPVEILNGMAMGWVEASYGSTGTYLGMRQGKLAVLCGGTTVFGIEQLRRPDGEIQSASTFAGAESPRVGDLFI